jgi:hypothetical protein
MRLHIRSNRSNGFGQVLPFEFLGRSAPSLQTIRLYGVPFPALPTLLLSASGLVTLDLKHIPPTGYISPESMVVGLAEMPRLESFTMGFKPANFHWHPYLICQPPATLTVLPALIRFDFEGANEYLEALVSWIDGPQLIRIDVHYSNPADFQATQLSQFIDRSVGSETSLMRHAKVIFSSSAVTFATFPHANDPFLHRRQVTIRCIGFDLQSYTAQMLSQFSVTLSSVVHLNLDLELTKGHQLDGMDDVGWLHLLRQFSTVKTLHVSRKVAGHIALSLRDITPEMVTEVLPSVDLIWLAGRLVKKFVAARRLSGRPVTVVGTLREFNERLGACVEN